MPVDTWTNPLPPGLTAPYIAQIERCQIADDVGSNGATRITIILPDSMAADLMTATTATATTPPAADCREVARPIGLALQEATLAGMELP